ncbi:DASH complex subunit DAD3 [Cryptococcus neoformans]|uniref:DASH complex subunit DAD3 n=2 Tax=Cryptococcus neoformans TaxID=5207 RepID=A0A854QFP7_CRYNE|nr:DASH complex subunit DAD3 [Cryptococcus neoformans var. grubii H99]AUB22865.1 DASH complex subunit DAD3 [Cryptococcus neoformans var. grubii]OWT41270.1 DASH complex subunit DAD3 [Cryptococcus neoformans var. grubii Bt1]OWZ34732.1 DASH complex subunit DAD3 [Cryptococcus neoformans var. grubii AD2-60a]OWZ46831.1 DASH complex subunit DAD3 [Cryptococcus neoformans var. grubii C23]OWZ50621.1 DASH complex subunit DAD3 [Cryptococcus neoformans var. grubii AD1-83a]OWZ56426.1 DASH complex subunit D|eukprot:XP_012047244.1 DASH complex subunit DAD3 [Cryptococcus neoformans var. grubii H99]
MSINTVNPYENNSQLSQLEQELLWEFAKLSDKVKRAASLAKLTAESPNESLLAELRTLEKRMGLVLTLVKASVWAVIVDSQAAEEARQQQSAESAPEISHNETRSWDDSIMQ